MNIEIDNLKDVFQFLNDNHEMGEELYLDFLAYLITELNIVRNL